jgi:hypothetical protein
MKQLLVVVALSMGFVATVGAQDHAQTKPSDAIPPVQAPPALGDPGSVVTPTPQTEAASAVKDQPRAADGALLSAHEAAETGKPPVDTNPLPPEVQKAAEASELPVITVRAQGAETVEEYRKKGKLYFVRVLSSNSAPRYYVDDPQAVPSNIMQQMSGPSGVVQPVYFKLVDWK